jgi:thiol:disulfide interchange protein
MKIVVYMVCLLCFLSCKEKQNAAPDEVQTSTAANHATTEEQQPVAEASGDGLNWLAIQAAADHKNEEGKMFFVDVYTDWCGWCKVMDKKTFSDPAVQKALNERFHVVKFNAEQKEAITLNNKKYEWQNAGRNGINTLAVEFLGGEMGFPSYVFLDKNKKPFKVAKGFMPADQFLAELSSIK